MRRAVFSSTGGRAELPRAAAASRSLSGGVPQRKNESREARSRSLTRYVAPGFTFSGCFSTRKMKYGFVRIASSALRTPPSNPPLAEPMS